MTLFEYAMVLVSIVLALGVAQLLGGASDFVRSSRVYLGHSFWVLALFLMHVQLWWAMWDLHNRASWTFLTFLNLLLGPTLLFFTTNLLLPRSATDSMDWGLTSLRYADGSSCSWERLSSGESLSHGSSAASRSLTRTESHNQAAFSSSWLASRQSTGASTYGFPPPMSSTSSPPLSCSGSLRRSAHPSYSRPTRACS